jgi:hypothetical protein
MLDDRFEDRLQEGARDYNAPPATPREEMWAAIVAARKETEKTERTGGQADRRTGRRDGIRLYPDTAVPPYRRLLPWSAGIAALLALGFGLGRLTQRPASAPTAVLATEASPRVSEAAYNLVTTEHLSQSEAFLTLFRASVHGGGNEQLASATARQLLATNRLLLDSPASSHARTKLLLQDLELVLAQIAQLAPQPRSRDLLLIREGLEHGDMLSRLRTVVPSGASTTQGAL